MESSPIDQFIGNLQLSLSTHSIIDKLPIINKLHLFQLQHFKLPFVRQIVLNSPFENFNHIFLFLQNSPMGLLLLPVLEEMGFVVV